MPKNGGWLPREPTKNRGMELSVPFPDFWGQEWGYRVNQSPKANNLINHSYAMKPYRKTQEEGAQRASSLVNQNDPECYMPPGAHKLLCSRPHPMYLFT